MVQHQQVALYCLVSLKKHNLLAVLVDETGLGWKITTISFLSILVVGWPLCCPSNLRPPHKLQFSLEEGMSSGVGG